MVSFYREAGDGTEQVSFAAVAWGRYLKKTEMAWDILRCSAFFARGDQTTNRNGMVNAHSWSGGQCWRFVIQQVTATRKIVFKGVQR